MKKLLSIANEYLKQGRISSIRCSTRPDYISEEVLDLLLSYGVGTVELGLQSSCNDVLELTRRGHDLQAEIRACKLIKQKGMRLGGQMMVGLPGSTAESDRQTARFMVEVGCDEARIYPTIVFRDTELSRMLDGKVYSALTLDEAVERSTDAFEILTRGGVRILRIGLCDSENLHSSETYIDGPNHPAIGELVEGEYYYRAVTRLIEESRENISVNITLNVPSGHTSKVAGHNKKNKIRLAEKYGIKHIKIVESDAVLDYTVSLGTEGRK
jgi:histone acetyltransferase (RNA polymerase elongator complex component)